MPFDRALQFPFTFTLFLNYRGAFSEKVKADFSVLSLVYSVDLFKAKNVQ